MISYSPTPINCDLQGLLTTEELQRHVGRSEVVGFAVQVANGTPGAVAHRSRGLAGGCGDGLSGAMGNGSGVV